MKKLITNTVIAVAIFTISAVAAYGIYMAINCKELMLQGL